MTKIELLKKLECLVSFQSECLREGNWEDYDKAEEKVKELEKSIINNQGNETQNQNKKK